jgi:DNA-binding transcriptional regulator GbsR (MarR family)
VKGYEPPAGNNIFAARWRQLIDVATEQCRRLQADNIKREYQDVAEAFNQVLGPLLSLQCWSNRAATFPSIPAGFLSGVFGCLGWIGRTHAGFGLEK